MAEYQLTDYQKKLKDPRWQKKRLLTMQRDNWECQSCHDTTSPLEVHHKTYFPNLEPWDYPDELLVTLCEDCHHAEGEERRHHEQALLYVLSRDFLCDDILKIAEGFNKISIISNHKRLANLIAWILSSDKIMTEMKERYFKEKNNEDDKLSSP